MIKVDFHVHTTTSDGVLSPTEVVQRAHKIQDTEKDMFYIQDHLKIIK